MNPKTARLTTELARKDTELQLRIRQQTDAGRRSSRPSVTAMWSSSWQRSASSLSSSCKPAVNSCRT
jgi:hypothetical protein